MTCELVLSRDPRGICLSLYQIPAQLVQTTRMAVLTIITSSKKRTRILYLLRDGPLPLREIKATLSTTWQTLNPQIHIMIEEGLISVKARSCELTDYGRAVRDILTPAQENLAVFEKNPEFWKTHMLRSIPRSLILRIRDLREAEIARAQNGMVFAPRLTKYLEAANTVQLVSGMIHPMHPKAFLEAALRGTHISVTLGPSAYAIVHEQFKTELVNYISLPNTELFVLVEDPKIRVLVTDKVLHLNLYHDTGEVDPAHDLVATTGEAIQWGQDLITVYRKTAKRM